MIILTLSKTEIFFWLNIFDERGPTPDNFQHYDYNNDGMDGSSRGAAIDLDIREIIKLMDILRHK